MLAQRISVYVHFPWCLRKCPYCDFATSPRERAAIDHRGYADAVLAELAFRAPVLAGAELYSVFFGGGTPSLWEPSELGRVLAGIRGAFGTEHSGCEITVECNPSSLDRERARALREVGVNRLSVGVQSLDDQELVFLGRLHNRELALAAIEGAQASFERVSADLDVRVARAARRTLPRLSRHPARHGPGARVRVRVDHRGRHALR
ncbi:MAG: radical SAM protein [Myxococcales bacterium]